ncbi:MAG: hypothetical protein RLZZ612_1068, partial [Pseudomonadota bacterium]
TDKNPARTLLEKHLATYTQKNSADYFIHKELGTFLRRELDFYIKNEVMNLDDIQNVAAFAAIEKNLVMIQTLRAIAQDLITFLASIEDFQKKLWLKKKFVVSSHWCVTLDRVPEALYPAIAANPAQWAAWHDLGLRDSANPGSVEDLKASPYMMVDTSLFDAAFRADLLKSIDNLDAQMDGLLVHGDNFQALSLLQDRYSEQVKCIYIDPPYNTDASAITYKNGYKSSSWMTLMAQVIVVSANLADSDCVICGSIDDTEVTSLRSVLCLSYTKQIGVAAVRANPQSRKASGKFSPVHEYAVFYGRSDAAQPSSIGVSDKKSERYPLSDSLGRFAWMNFIRAGSEDLRSDRPKSFYPIWVLPDGDIYVPDLCWNNELQAYDILETLPDNVIEVYPVKSDGGVAVEKRWQRGHERVRREYQEFRSRIDGSGKMNIDFKTRMDDAAAPTTWWDKPEYASSNFGAAELAEMIPNSGFDYPKTKGFVIDALRASGASQETITLDFFAGSGTTAEAVTELNRIDKGARKYILVEQGAYFDTVTRPRALKAAYSTNWKNGKAVNSATGISHAFKVLKLESYEDTVNNLNLTRAPAQSDLLAALPPKEHDAYLMAYMLDVESRGSLLSVEDFKKPFDYRLKIAVDSAGAWAEQNVDLVETFNYLIGLTIKSIDMQWKQGFVAVEGTLPSGERALILWRDCEKVDYEGLQKLCDRLAINPGDREYDVIYINGDHTLPSVLERDASEGGDSVTVKLRQIEPAFLSAMFDVEDV